MSKVIKMGVYEETSVYRYMPVERFLEIVENEQNTLSHISKWEDPNEAYLIRSRIVANAQRGDDESVRKWYDQYRSYYGQSWMLKADESDVLWRAYGDRGNVVRIQTTIKSLCDTLDHFLEKETEYEINAYAGAVTYVEKMAGSVSENAVQHLFVKRQEFSDENEFRIIVQVTEMDQKVQKNEILIKGGLLRIPVAVSDVIKSALLDPCCSRRLLDEVRCRVMNAGFDFEVKRSGLFEWPTVSNVSEAIAVNASGNVATDSVPQIYKHQDAPEIEFWKRFNAAYRDGKSEFAELRVPNRRYWGFPIGNGMSYCVVCNRDCTRVELYIDSPDKEWNKNQYRRIEKLLKVKYPNEDSLVFQEFPDGRASRIAIVNTELKFGDETQWGRIIEWFIGALDRFREMTEDLVVETEDIKE
jgi:hypothetical protein